MMNAGRGASEIKRKAATILAALAAHTIVTTLCAPAAACAQTVLPSEIDISRQRVSPLPLPEPDFNLNIISPEKTGTPRAVDEVSFKVVRIQITGNTVFEAYDLAEIFASLEGRKIQLDELRQAADRLETAYRKRGYILTRVFIPPQELKDDVIEVRIVEGYIAEVFVDGREEGARKLAQSLVGPVVDARPVRLSDIEGPMLILNDLPGMRATSVLKPGAAFGSSNMFVNVDRRPTQSFLSVGNGSSDAVGPMTYALGTAIARPFGTAGLLDLSLSSAGEAFRELKAISVRYSAPLGTNGAIVSVGLVAARAAPGGEISALEVRSKSYSGNVRVRLPIVRTRANSVALDIGLNLNRSFVSALDTPINDDRSTVFDIAINWRQVGWLGGDFSLRAGLARGVALLGANDANTLLPSVSGFEPQFTKVNFLLQRSQPLFGNLSASALVQGQYSPHRLLSGEQQAFGGGSIGRGYNPAQLAGDKGIGALGELRLDLPKVSVGPLLQRPQAFVFGDWSVATTRATTNVEATTARLASLGFGMRATAFGRLALDAQVARARKALSTGELPGDRVNFTATLVF